MIQRFTIEIVRDGDALVATSPQHPALRGVGRTLGESLARLGEAIAPFVPGEPVSHDGAGTSAEAAEKPCAEAVSDVKWTDEQAVRASAEKPPMPKNSGSRSPYYIHGNARPIPGALEWLKEHRDEYLLRWVAVGPEGLVAAADTLDALETQVDIFGRVLVARVT